MTATVIAALIYTAMVGVGVAARQQRRRFGRWHHVGYGCSCVAALAAFWVSPMLLLVLPVLALAALPLTKGGSPAHLMVGVAGWIGWMIVVVVQFLQ